ncbi:hypothetical protein BJV82DRAFT_599009 [Fennellomyces sp. T-0311]|nr:hypothetical protein BJV82DRAFT_599009 [Fennellomyces sp. T-0311]
MVLLHDHSCHSDPSGSSCLVTVRSVILIFRLPPPQPPFGSGFKPSKTAYTAGSYFGRSTATAGPESKASGSTASHRSNKTISCTGVSHFVK